MKLRHALSLFGTAAVLTAGQAAAADVVELQAHGVQVYACAAAADVFLWRLKAPEAVLTTAQGAPAGRHFAGPSWQALDGSTVVGEAVASGTAPGTIPWVVLRAKSHEGAGVFAAVGTIVRTRTSGGLAPATGCDRDHAGVEARVEYSATYTFFPGTLPPG